MKSLIEKKKLSKKNYVGTVHGWDTRFTCDASTWRRWRQILPSDHYWPIFLRYLNDTWFIQLTSYHYRSIWIDLVGWSWRWLGDIGISSTCIARDNLVSNEKFRPATSTVIYSAFGRWIACTSEFEDS